MAQFNEGSVLCRGTVGYGADATRFPMLKIKTSENREIHNSVNYGQISRSNNPEMSSEQIVTPDVKSLQEIARERTVKTQPIEYDITTIKNRVEAGYIKLDPSYQRRYRWDEETASRLIESLILNIPIPIIYLSQDVDLDEEAAELGPVYSVIDGQQRLTTIVDFLKNDLQLIGLSILKELDGMRYNDLPPFLKRRLQDRTVGCLRIDSTLDADVKFDIFERLNTGSVQLTAQEIRNATYRGDFNELIKRLARNADFRANVNLSDDRESKMFDVELVLRYFSMVNKRYLNYQPLLKDFLNGQMKTFSTLSKSQLDKMEEQFARDMKDIRSFFGPNPFAKLRGSSEGETKGRFASKFNAAVFDAVVVALNNLGGTAHIRPDSKDRLASLFDSTEFQSTVSGSVTDTSKLLRRIEMVEDAFHP